MASYTRSLARVCVIHANAPIFRFPVIEVQCREDKASYYSFFKALLNLLSSLKDFMSSIA